MSARWIGVLLVPLMVRAQEQSGPEQQELIQVMSDANNSAVDVVRVLEAFLKKYPQSAQRKEVERALSKAAIDSKDDRRTVQYGEPVLAVTPQDIPLLDRVTYSLLALGGRENAEKAFKYGHSFEIIITEMEPPEGVDAARKQEERDRAMGRVLLYESRAKATLGEKDQAEQFAARSFSVYPTEEGAREWSEALTALGRDEDALKRMADAFAIPDPRATDADRASDRKRLREEYRKLHESEAGLGELILAAYDHTSGLVDARRRHLQTMDQNYGATDPMQFTITGLDGKKLGLGSLKGRVVIMDFWATWCVPCRTQHPMYEIVKQRFKDRSDVVFLAIDADEDHVIVEPFLDSQKWSHAQVYFEDGLQRLLKVDSIPTTIMFDKRGRLWSRMNGFAPDRFIETLTERIQTALAANERE